ncbi:hypothetical protein BGZ61DRAFT_467419 [Ilyonectria robusta]|uniref:uncharacterized protein n=1 Tax=Ilyonectria robusta TaxID=1079257 RepID=UPI001E8D19B7|nr:uncharacterized protein BGZ61DRAFT_467419 [Ilyonectria robusta]KAH8654770.1 hypothetical protein BGZ61DRAFT_467419 [Ilyonectria robusta]
MARGNMAQEREEILAYVDLADIERSGDGYEAMKRNPRKSWNEKDNSDTLEELEQCFGWQAPTTLIPAFSHPTDLFRRAAKRGKSNVDFLVVNIHGLRFWRPETLEEKFGYRFDDSFEFGVPVIWSGVISVDRIQCDNGSISILTSLSNSVTSE